jgi:hypothetical protein
VEVAAATRLEIHNSAPSAFEFRNTGEIFSSVQITGLDGSGELGRAGGTLLQTKSDGPIAVNYRFALLPGILPGTYAWPLALTVLPM